MGLLQVRQELWRYHVTPGYYLTLRIALTILILGVAGALLRVQARWLNVIADFGSAALAPRGS
jgi:hypothetical protein